MTVLFTLTSCSPYDEVSLAQICSSQAQICNDLHRLTACSYKRSDLIRARYYEITEPSQQHTLGLLDALDTYESCIELTLLMQSNRYDGKKEKRIQNYFTTKKLLEDKIATIKNTENPHIAYYLWTHLQDTNAKQVFLNAAKQKDIKDTKLLIKLATFYATSSPQTALNLFYRGLRVSKSIEEIPGTTFSFLLTLFYQHKNFELAYIWALITDKIHNEDEYPINFDLILQKGHLSGDKLIRNEDELQSTADMYYDQLSNGEFNYQAPILRK